MKDVNLPLRTAYNTALSTLTVPVFANYIPIGAEAETYIVFSNVTNNDISTKQSSDISAIMQVAIYTYSDIGNSGEAVDTLANQVFSLLYNNTRSVLNLGALFQMLSTELNSDQTNQTITIGQRVYIDRILQFKHEIFIL